MKTQTIQTIRMPKPSAETDLLDLSLWLAQWTLAAFFSVAGLLKTCLPDELLARLGLASGAQAGQYGAVELALALAVILPAATRLAPKLSVLAAAVLGVLALLGALSPHGAAGVGAQGANAVLAVVALYAVWGRLTFAPLSAMEAAQLPAGSGALRGERAAPESVPESAPGWKLGGPAYSLAAGPGHDLQ